MRVFRFIKKEFFHVLPLFLFFLFFFSIINVVETFLFERAGITPVRFAEIALTAALIAKVVLVIDHMPYINLFRKKGLIYVVFWKTFNYWIILFLIRLGIRYVSYVKHANQPFFQQWTDFKTHFDWNLFISVQVFYLLFMFIYVCFRELTLKIGAKKMKQIFFK